VVKLRISYDNDEELKGVMKILAPVITKVKKHNQNDKRVHKLAYMDIKTKK